MRSAEAAAGERRVFVSASRLIPELEHHRDIDSATYGIPAHIPAQHETLLEIWIGRDFFQSFHHGNRS
jgi:hypothetical protein